MEPKNKSQKVIDANGAIITLRGKHDDQHALLYITDAQFNHSMLFLDAKGLGALSEMVDFLMQSDEKESDSK